MSPLTGRPKIDNPKDYSFKIRFDKETLQRIKKTSDNLNITRTELIRTAIDLFLSKNE